MHIRFSIDINLEGLLESRVWDSAGNEFYARSFQERLHSVYFLELEIQESYELGEDIIQILAIVGEELFRFLPDP